MVPSFFSIILGSLLVRALISAVYLSASALLP
jgi:hypothetical protein